jgi:hypothetical protein
MSFRLKIVECVEIPTYSPKDVNPGKQSLPSGVVAPVGPIILAVIIYNIQQATTLL